MERKNAWKMYSEEELTAVEKLSFQYRRFLNAGKTERECVAEAVRLAEKNGYQKLDRLIKNRQMVRPGDKIYISHMGKAAVFFQIGEQSLEHGMNIIGAHVDSPRLDIKQIPLYEETEQVYLDTHYYGGVKKYQWLAIPLALHGVVIRKDGKQIEIRIGENPEDPVFTITDLLPHLGKEQQEQKVKEFIDAEKMDLLVGNQSRKDKSAKEYVLQLLYEKYRIREEDFLSAELEVVPAGEARECGIDRSMIMAYGQDDRSCAFASLTALFDLAQKGEHVKRTACCLLTDKEEIGSAGATGMKSHFFENALAELLNLEDADTYSLPLELRLRRALMHSKMLSADVSAAFDPMFEKYFEKKNTAYFANGLVFNKYSGSAGKAGANDANAEYMAELRNIMESQNVLFQTAELGAVDQGGGGTIAYIMAEYGMDVIDCGIAVLSMHAPWEISCKADLYEAVKGYRAFYGYTTVHE